MESVGYFIRSSRLPGHFFEKCLASDLNDASHVMPVKGMYDFILFAGAFEGKLNFLTKMVCLGWVPLFNNDFDDVFVIKHFVGNHGDVDNTDLGDILSTSSRLKKSTGGTILSARVLMNSRNSSLCFLLISWPTTCPSLSSIPM